MREIHMGGDFVKQWGKPIGTLAVLRRLNCLRLVIQPPRICNSSGSKFEQLPESVSAGLLIGEGSRMGARGYPGLLRRRGRSSTDNTINLRQNGLPYLVRFRGRDHRGWALSEVRNQQHAIPPLCRWTYASSVMAGPRIGAQYHPGPWYSLLSGQSGDTCCPKRRSLFRCQ
jgi:hypothetical protein